MKDVDMWECVDERALFEVTKGFWWGHIFAPGAGTSQFKVKNGDYNSADLQVSIQEIFEWLCGESESNNADSWNLHSRHGEFLLNAFRRHIVDGDSLDVAFGYKDNIKKGSAKWSSDLEIGVCAIPFLIMQQRLIEEKISGLKNTRIQLKSIIPDAIFAVKNKTFKLKDNYIQAYEVLTESSLTKKFTHYRTYLQEMWDFSGEQATELIERSPNFANRVFEKG